MPDNYTKEEKYTRLANAVIKFIASLILACKFPHPMDILLVAILLEDKLHSKCFHPSSTLSNPLPFLVLIFSMQKELQVSITFPFLQSIGANNLLCDCQEYHYLHTRILLHMTVFFQVANTCNKVTQCIITDNGCGDCSCPSKESHEWVRTAVGNTVN